MAWAQVLLRSIGEALCAKGLRGLAGVVPFGEVVFDVAVCALERFREHQAEANERLILEEAIQAALEEVKEEARAVAHQVCQGYPEADPSLVAGYLMQIPSLLRQTCKRPSDSSGLSIPLALSLDKPEDWLAFLPARLPHFRPGDQPPGIGDWELVELLGVGGFGEVWKARHRWFDGIAPVALKFCLD
ncbi:MAG: hypothetical protein JO112_24010, partial [Planctomycetes bacterium]|nr:hypothetical protein [Planctomycetota bacterium]